MFPARRYSYLDAQYLLDDYLQVDRGYHATIRKVSYFRCLYPKNH